MPLLDLGEVPVFCNVQWLSRAEAVASAKGPLALASCVDCGHVFNHAFDSHRLAYAPGYENSQHASSVFREYAERMIVRLVETYHVRGCNVVDIGCGRGDLLAMLCERGGNSGFGFDPSYAGTAPPSGAAFEIYREYFGAEHARRIKPALVCCRHVLEHIEDPSEFLRTLHESLSASGNPILYLEVPSGEELLTSNGLWDYLFEHVSYFTARSLRLVLEASGFEVLRLCRDFGGQFLCADVRVAESGRLSNERVEGPVEYDVQTATRSLTAQLERWREWARGLEKDNSVAVWGAGSKGVMFLNLLGLRAPGPVGIVIDQNSAKHGRYVSGTGQMIVPPEVLASRPVDQVVLMNGIYRAEVAARLAALGSSARLTVAWP